jgi:hypothetical protein
MGEGIGENLEAGEGAHMNATAQGQSGRAQDESGREVGHLKTNRWERSAHMARRGTFVVRC